MRAAPQFVPVERTGHLERDFNSTKEANMFVAFRAITYATVFVGFLLIYLPARLLSGSGIVRPAGMESQQIMGMIVGSAGAVAALWCISTFVWIGKGTPSPFDPPRRLVIRGPYRLVRNPMYIGAGPALAGAALFYKSLPLLVYGCGFLAVSHFFVMLYEEPALRRKFGPEYEAYCHRVRRWWPGV
jgi:protein-S-isoprenylcysteine O-methyltransferase Ste14